MRRERLNWRDRYEGEVTCVRCLDKYDPMYLDRLLWCDECRAAARERAGWWGWLGGLLFAGAIAAYIWITIRPTDLVIGGWFGTVVMAAWLGQKVAREIAYGAMRAMNNRAIEAVPPGPEVLDPPDAEA